MPLNRISFAALKRVAANRSPASASHRRTGRGVALLIAFAGLASAGVSAAADTARTPFLDIGGIPFGEHADAVDWLTPTTTRASACASESHYRASDPTRRFALANVRLAGPGLVYKFHDGRLYAVEGEIPAGRQSFDTLFDALTWRYGQADVVENWAGSPADSFIYQYRLRMAGWFDADTQQSVWLTGHRDGGAIRVTRSAPRSAPGHGCGEPVLSLADRPDD